MIYKYEFPNGGVCYYGKDFQKELDDCLSDMLKEYCLEKSNLKINKLIYNKPITLDVIENVHLKLNNKINERPNYRLR